MTETQGAPGTQGTTGGGTNSGLWAESMGRVGPPPPPDWGNPPVASATDGSDTDARAGAAPMALRANAPARSPGRPMASLSADAPRPYGRRGAGSSRRRNYRYGNPASFRSTNVSYMTYRYRNRQGRPVYSRRGGNAGRPVMILVLGLFSFGLLWPFAALGYWIRYGRLRKAPAIPGLGIRALIWAVTFTALTLVAAAFYTAVGVNGSSNNTAGYQAPVSLSLSLGQTATLREPVEVDIAKTGEVLSEVTVTSVAYPTSLASVDPKAPPDTAAANVTVCAVDKPVGPSAVVFNMVMNLVTGSQPIHADFDTAFQTGGFRTDLAPHKCMSGDVGFAVPSGATIATVQYGLLNIATWSVP